MNLPALPEPDSGPSYHTCGISYFNDDTMRKYALAAVLAEREACAKLCDELEGSFWSSFKGLGYFPKAVGSSFMEGMSDGAGDCAAAIRARRTEDAA